MGNTNSHNKKIAYKHAEHFYELISAYSVIYPVDETACLNYIDKYSDFYDIKIGTCENSALLNAICLKMSNKIIFRLIDQKADVNTYNISNITPLTAAVLSSDYTVITRLVDAGANINNDNPVPLLCSLYHNQYSVATYLIDKGAHFNEYINIFDDKRYFPTNYEIFTNIKNYIRLLYKQSIHNIINDKSVNNAMARCFATTYVPQLVDVICEFII
ncbi:MAG: hypothetical protein Faunusvirus29_8 [Faunusvirus sp.]|jgi:ankyrin repeat protein|uniref:Uncharacterized protein n=1 Tax=Faunusvirus sp. TaxID=2487766 RepID=A0A3G5A2A5_9VIRU|nr:MAG: hypothetical protein Faunusvirus29_8 [Faunusvirus sp.]